MPLETRVFPVRQVQWGLPELQTGLLVPLVRQGKALYVGVSSYSGAQFADAVRTCDRMGLAPITIHQPYYNMLGREIEWDLLPQTERAGTGAIVFCPLASGHLPPLRRRPPSATIRAAASLYTAATQSQAVEGLSIRQGDL